MNGYKALTIALLALAGVFLFVTVKPTKSAARPASDSTVARVEKKGLSGLSKKANGTGRERSATHQKARPVASSPEAGTSDTTQDLARTGAAVRTTDEGKRTPREKAVETWEALVDQLAKQKDVSPAEQAPRVKEAFDQLDKADQMDGIQRSLNLLPDEQFPVLYAILYDKKENPEVLDAIFSDALNRPEELKNPLMKELVKDKEHPCFFESARILDVIGELEPKPAPTPSP